MERKRDMRNSYNKVLESGIWNLDRCRRMAAFLCSALVLCIIYVSVETSCRHKALPQPQKYMILLVGDNRCYITGYNDQLVFAGSKDERSPMKLDTLDKLINMVDEDISQDAVEASLSFKDKQPVIQQGCKGMYVDKGELKRRIVYAVKSKCCTVNIPINVVEPKISNDYISKSYGLLAMFSTNIVSNNSDRTQNIRIAAGYMDGTVVLPWETFSANRAIGTRTKEKGYRNAPVIMGGTTTPGLAGGICQLVTTTYNAALLCDYKIVQRSKHGLAVAYISPGRDAAISGDTVDLKFINTGSFPICIRSCVNNNKVIVEIYGVNEKPDRRVEITVNTLSSTASALKTVTYRSVYKGGILVRKEELSRDSYYRGH